MNIRLLHGDCLEIMPTLDADSIDSIVTDPPYGLSFMGKDWDHGVPGEHFWGEALRVAKPGAHLLAFGGTRTFHRLAVAIEDAGWEIRDCVMWLYGSGFPKSLDVSKAIDKAAGAEREVVGEKRREGGPTGFTKDKGWNPSNMGNEPKMTPILAPATDAAKQWDGWGTALKPAWEPIIVARKPLIGTVAENVQKYGTGAINVDGCRIPTDSKVDDPRLGGGGRWSTKHMAENVYAGGYAGDFVSSSPKGRWPANLIHDGSQMVMELFPVTGASKAAARGGSNPNPMDWGNGRSDGDTVKGHDDNGGSAARFFYQAKAGRYERFSHLTCNCETVKLCSWQKQDQNQNGQMDATSPDLDTSEETSTESSSFSTLPHGSESMDQFRMDTNSIISTETDKTTNSKICDSSPTPNTNGFTEDAKSEKASGSNPVIFAGESFQSLPSTFICPEKDGRFTGVVVGATSPLLSGVNRCEGCGSEIRKSAHPTQKPESLMRYLCRLVTPPNGVILDPFMGSGSTGKAALKEGFRFIGIEKNPEYIEIARARTAQTGLSL